MKYFLQPIGANTPFWGSLFGSVSSVYLHARITLEYSPETRGEFAKQFLPSFFNVRKEFFPNAFFLGTCWTISRFITEKGLSMIARSFCSSNEEGANRKIKAISVCGSTFLSSFIAFGCFYLAQSHFPFMNTEYNLELGVLMESALNVNSCFFVGALSAEFWP